MQGMHITLNGESLELHTPLTLAELVDHRGLREARVAIEVNGVIAPRSQHHCWTVQAGDRIEIVRALGGG